MKKVVLIVILILMLSVYPIFNIMGFSKNGETSSDIDLSQGSEIIRNLSGYDVKKAQKNVNIAEKEREHKFGNYHRVDDVLADIDSGKTTYRKVFQDVYIVGDSLMNGLEAYNILNSNHLVTQVSASLYHLDGNLNKIIRMNPPILILHYGVNMISTERKYMNNYITMYTSLIQKLQASLPDTRIIISGIFPVDRNVARASRFGMINEYNQNLIAMCEKLDIEYMDSSSVLYAHPECYGGDGIHLSKAFYEKYWLRFIIREMGITG